MGAVADRRGYPFDALTDLSASADLDHEGEHSARRSARLGGASHPRLPVPRPALTMRDRNDLDLANVQPVDQAKGKPGKDVPPGET